jgi:hypothetical protein
MNYFLSEEEWDAVYRMGCKEDAANLKTFAAEGIYRGGEEIVFRKLGPNQVIPYNIEEIIDVGMKALSSELFQLKTVCETEQIIKKALQEKKGFSLIRLGDGELLAMAHDIFIPSNELSNDHRFQFLSYAGINVPDHCMRDILTQNVLQANVVGVPKARYPTYQRLFIKLAHHWKWPLKEMCLTHSLINYQLNEETYLFHHLLSHYKVLLIGNRMREAIGQFHALGYKNVVGEIPVAGVHAVPRVMNLTQRYDFDIALVSAGIAANLICVDIAKQNKIAIDFGHLIDRYLNGSALIRLS